MQHLESLNDLVTSITGIVVNERIPDHVFDRANQVELVDIAPADLEKRLEEDPEDGTARAMTEAIRHGADWVSREQLRPVLTAWEGRA